MELIDSKIPWDSYHLSTISQASQMLDPGPPRSTVLTHSTIDVYINENRLHHPSMSSTEPSNDNINQSITNIDPEVLERINPANSDRFGSATETYKACDKQPTARECSLRQLYSFLTEISLSGSQPCNVPSTPTPEYENRGKTSPEKKYSSSATWSPDSSKAGKPYIKYKHSSNQPTTKARQVSLNKNRLAAAKCRANKNIQNNKLRESAHAIVAVNTSLKREVLYKMEEIQALHTEILCHVVEDGCRDPQELREYLCNDKLKDVQAMSTQSDQSY